MPEPRQQREDQGDLAEQEANGVYITATSIPLPFDGFLWGTSSPPHLVPSFGPNSTPAPGDGACDPDLSASVLCIFLATVTGPRADA